MFTCYGNAPSFIPANLNRCLVLSGYIIAKALAHIRYAMQVHISPEDLMRLKVLANTRSILLANHPTPHDWLIFYLLSAKLRFPLHYMTAHEQFAGGKQLWLPKFGAYSIRRGGWGDVAGVKETMRLLDRHPGGLVMFPEGRCSFSSTGLMEFRVGAAKIGFGYLDRYAASKHHEPDLLLVPIAIRYEYVEPIEHELQTGIERLENILGTAPIGSLVQRLHSLVHELVARLESKYSIAQSERLPEWHDRIELLCNKILMDSERAAGIGRAPRTGITDRACNIRQTLAVQGHQFGVKSKAAYERMYFPTLLVLILESIGKFNLAGEATLSDKADLLWTLERVFYRDPDPRSKGRRRATICVAESLNLRHYLSNYRVNKRGVVRQVTAAVQANVGKHLKAVGNASGEENLSFIRPVPP